MYYCTVGKLLYLFEIFKFIIEQLIIVRVKIVPSLPNF